MCWIEVSLKLNSFMYQGQFLDRSDFSDSMLWLHKEKSETVNTCIRLVNHKCCDSNWRPCKKEVYVQKWQIFRSGKPQWETFDFEITFSFPIFPNCVNTVETRTTCSKKVKKRTIKVLHSSFTLVSLYF